jgi:co-chaperonin GroES (HSP10)
MKMSEVTDTETWIGIAKNNWKYEAAPPAHPCGLHPVEFNVIIEQDEVEEKTKGGLILIDQEKQKNMATRGTIVAVSPLAFTYEEWPEGSRKPDVGARVAFVQHAGKLIEGQDGKEYRIIKDKDVLAVLR